MTARTPMHLTPLCTTWLAYMRKLPWTPRPPLVFPQFHAHLQSPLRTLPVSLRSTQAHPIDLPIYRWTCRLTNFRTRTIILLCASTLRHWPSLLFQLMEKCVACDKWIIYFITNNWMKWLQKTHGTWTVNASLILHVVAMGTFCCCLVSP